MPVKDPFLGGELPSMYPEARTLPAVQRFLAEQVDMQFADLRAIMRLPMDAVAPSVGCNLTATAAIMNQISGFSIWFFHNRAGKVIEGIERKMKRRDPLSGRRFKSFVRAYYPREPGEPTLTTIAERMYESRNLLSHNLGVGDLKHTSRRREVALMKPDPPLSAQDVVDLELQPVFPLAGRPIRRVGTVTTFYVPGLYWALGRMLRAALSDQPARCEAQAELLLRALPVPRIGR